MGFKGFSDFLRFDRGFKCVEFCSRLLWWFPRLSGVAEELKG